MMMSGNSYLKSCITSVFLVAISLDCPRSLAQQPSLEKVRLAYPARSLSALHIQVAQERGIYRKHGFQVEPIQMRATITVAALLSKEVQYVASLGSSVRAALRGAPIKVVAVSLTAPFFSLVTRPNIRTVQDLRDKEIGVTGNPGSTNDQVVRMILREAGLDPQRDVKLLHLGDPPVLYSAFKGGRFAAISVSLPFPVVAEQEGYKILANAAESIKLPFIGLAVTDETLRLSREQVKRMIRADVEARRYIGREKDHAIDVMMRWLGLSRSVALRSYDLVRPAISQDFNLDRAGLQKLIDMESEHGEVLKITDPDLISDSKLLAEARRGE
jgi:ABC-type nitrate/sulfonate/bicarbonate transport system substrate-binding protein